MLDRQADVCVVGAGPAGLAAAVTAAEAGARVIMLDQAPSPGGQIWRRDFDAPPPAAACAWLERAEAAGDRLERLHGAAVVDGSLEPTTLVTSSRAGALRITAAKLVIACGATERFLPFPGWTLPGVVGVGALQAFAKQGLPVAGRELVIAGTGPLLLAVAADMIQRGAKIMAIVEQSPRRKLMGLGASALRHPSKRRQAVGLAARLATVTQHFGAWPVAAEGRDAVTHVIIDRERALGRREQIRLRCDLLACSFGLVPETRLAALLGLEIRDTAIVTDTHQRAMLASSQPVGPAKLAVLAAGECCGIGGVDLALIEGEIAGLVAADRTPPPALLDRRDQERGFAARLDSCYSLRPELRELPAPSTIVCRCEGVVLERLRGFADPRAAKLQTRCGMGPCQGRVCGPATQTLFGWAQDRPRAPLSPIPIDQL
ncbi:NAD(P)/FAD-dependent oxidoreductase [Enhygromyxa salina]|uniref:Hydrogen cyanide synthase subunit HcnB n=1 Tax=Enhygromyxa salina TaxID=215803 RepID=A0A2S9YP06_9BACT|nr:FAD/NAD(P)-binding oxidoreductase [Enhygromyxa salina]PRQ06817.1 Hydrogen cyanide synthase subunit HcnB [Enhygromyxa salina]